MCVCVFVCVCVCVWCACDVCSSAVCVCVFFFQNYKKMRGEINGKRCFPKPLKTQSRNIEISSGSVREPNCLSIWLSICLSFWLSGYLSVGLCFFCLSAPGSYEFCKEKIREYRKLQILHRRADIYSISIMLSM